jgi:hypothetical protein
MMKYTIKHLATSSLALGMFWVLTALGSAAAETAVQSAGESPALASSPVNAADSNNAGGLDTRRRRALGMIETGNNDNEIGGAGEVSRYQIMPSVWRHYNDSDCYRDPAVSLAVARQHWHTLYSEFKRQAHRDPDDFDMYVLWNTRYGYYASRGFNPHRLNRVVRDRAQRFVNLVRCDEL